MKSKVSSHAIFRTVTWNQETPFETNGFPKYLASFSVGKEIRLEKDEIEEGDEEKDLNESHGKEMVHEQQEDDDNEDIKSYEGMPMPHPRHDSCTLPYCGLSFKDHTTCHNGINVSSLSHAFADVKKGNRGIWVVNWIADADERKKQLKKFIKEMHKLSLKAPIYCCYRLNTDSLGDIYVVAYDGTSCNRRREKDHVTVYPVKNVVGKLLKITSDQTKMFLYCEDLLSSGWTPCCIRVRCEARPKDYDSHFDLDCWTACNIIYDYIGGVLDYEEADILFSFMSIMERNEYSVTAFKDVDSVWLSTTRDAIGNLITEILEYDEADCLIKMTHVIKEVIVLKDQNERSKLLMYGDNVVPLEEEDIGNDPVPMKGNAVAAAVLETSLPMEFDLVEAMKVYFSFVSTMHVINSSFVHVINLLIAVNCKASYKIGSVMIMFGDMPRELSAQLEKILTEDEKTAEIFQQSVLKVSHLEDLQVSYLAVATVNLVATLQPPVHQAAANTYLTLFETSAFGWKRGKNVCRSTSQCIKHMKDSLWQRSQQRVMFVCLSSKHTIDIGKLYTDEKSQSSTDSYDKWLDEVKPILRNSQNFMKYFTINHDSLYLVDQVEKFFFLLISFDNNPVLHQASYKVVIQCLKRYGIESVQEEDLMLES